MINITRYSVNSNISVKSLIQVLEEYQAKEKELAGKMYSLRGIFPCPMEYIELRNQMAGIKAMLTDILYCRYGNINGHEVINDCGFIPPDDWKKAEKVFDAV